MRFAALKYWSATRLTSSGVTRRSNADERNFSRQSPNRFVHLVPLIQLEASQNIEQYGPLRLLTGPYLSNRDGEFVDAGGNVRNVDLQVCEVISG